MSHHERCQWKQEQKELQEKIKLTEEKLKLYHDRLVKVAQKIENTASDSEKAQTHRERLELALQGTKKNLARFETQQKSLEELQQAGTLQLEQHQALRLVKVHIRNCKEAIEDLKERLHKAKKG